MNLFLNISHCDGAKLTSLELLVLLRTTEYKWKTELLNSGNHYQQREEDRRTGSETRKLQILGMYISATFCESQEVESVCISIGRTRRQETKRSNVCELS